MRGRGGGSGWGFWFLGSLGISFTVVVLITPSTAWAAQPPTSCINRQYNVEGYDADTASNQRGIRSSMFTGTVYYCVRVSSLAVIADDGEFVEWGWILGYVGTGAGIDGCPVTLYQTEPQLLGVHGDTDAGTGWTCFPQPYVVNSGFYYTWSLHDDNQNSWWRGNINGTNYLSMDSAFTNGEGVTNAERDNDSDLADATFNALEELYSNGWSSWEDVRQFVDTDPGYNFVRTGANSHYVG